MNFNMKNWKKLQTSFNTSNVFSVGRQWENIYWYFPCSKLHFSIPENIPYRAWEGPSLKLWKTVTALTMVMCTWSPCDPSNKGMDYECESRMLHNPHSKKAQSSSTSGRIKWHSYYLFLQHLSLVDKREESLLVSPNLLPWEASQDLC